MAWKPSLLSRMYRVNGTIDNETRYVLDGADVHADLNDSGTVLRRYLRGDGVDQLFGRVDGAGTNVWWYVTDRQSSVIAMLTGNGQEAKKRLAYRGFSALPFCVVCASGLDDRYEYTGREFDRTTVLQYNRNRWYDPYSGRWISEDPIGHAGDVNLYRYAGNSPTNATDPTGHWPSLDDIRNYAAEAVVRALPQSAVEWLAGSGGAQLEQSIGNLHDPVDGKRVEELFVRVGRILHLHVGGQVIRTTPEHPFFVHRKGWITGAELENGDLLSSHDGRWLPVEDLLDTGESETVYNFRVADWHTCVGD